MAWFGLFPSVLFGYWYFITFPFSYHPLYLLSLILLFFVLFGIALLSSLISAKIGVWLVHKRITYPELGTYRLSMEEPQTRAFMLKGNIKNFGRWLYYFFHLQFLKIFWMRRFGVKIGKNVKVGQYAEDEEFLEIGDNTYMARETVVTGHMEDHENLTLCQTVIGKNCILSFATGGTGAVLGDNSILKPITAFFKGQIFRGNAVYEGIPAKKVGEYSDLSPEDIEELKHNIRKMDKKNFIKEKNAPIKISGAKLFALKILVVIGGCLLTSVFLYLYYLFFKSFYIPGNHLLNILILTPVPFLFIILMGTFVVGSAIIIKILLIYYDRKADIPEGTYDVDAPRMKIFKIKYLLQLFGLRIFRGTPFRIADTFALRFWGKVKLGTLVKLDTAIVDPQYLEIGDHSQISARTRIHTHDIQDGKVYIKKVKIGKNVLLGGYCHIKPGVEIADGSFGGIAAWFRKNRKCKRCALYMGKPAFELPIEFVTKAATVKDKYID